MIKFFYEKELLDDQIGSNWIIKFLKLKYWYWYQAQVYI